MFKIESNTNCYHMNIPVFPVFSPTVKGTIRKTKTDLLAAHYIYYQKSFQMLTAEEWFLVEELLEEIKYKRKTTRRSKIFFATAPGSKKKRAIQKRHYPKTRLSSYTYNFICLLSTRSIEMFKNYVSSKIVGITRNIDKCRTQ